jgi:hypothetical protein
MPIRLNLLAEVQAAEDLRRRDPVKRAIWIGAFLVACMLTWSSYVWAKTMVANRNLSRVENDMGQHTNEYRGVMENRKKADDTRRKLEQLRKLASSRFLNGNLLNALQQTTVEDVQLMHLAVKQEYLLTEEVKGKTNAADGRVSGFKPATVKETITLTLEAKDSSPVPGDQVNPYKDTLSANQYFLSALGRTNEIRLNFVSPPNPVSPTDPKPFRTFTLECRFPEKMR